MSAEKNTKSCEYRSSLNSIIKRMILAVRTFIIFRGKSISRGAILVETALTLPIFCYLVFFLLELMKINETQTAVETITTESTFDFVYNKSIAKIDAIIEKHRPRFIPVDNIRYWIRMYESLDTMCSESPYGGEGIAYPDGECAITHSGLDLSENMEFIDIEKNNIFLLSTKNISNNTVKTYLNNNNIPSGIVFVITIVCNYPFSSAMASQFFSGGNNTIKNDGNGSKGSMYLLWGRGVGIVN